MVRDESPFKTLADLVNAAKASPGKLTYATAGVGGATHVGMEEFLLAAGAKMNHIPYKGGAPALADLMGGQVDALADSSSWAQYVESGKLRLLATWGEKRPPRFANVPTLKDAGYDVVVDAPNGIGAPAAWTRRWRTGCARRCARPCRAPSSRRPATRSTRRSCTRTRTTTASTCCPSTSREKRLIEKLNLKEQIKNG